MRLILYCTAKLLRELDPAIVQPDPDDAEHGASWCLNLIRIERKKCLLAMHEETRFAVFVPNVVRKDLRELPALSRAPSKTRWPLKASLRRL